MAIIDSGDERQAELWRRRSPVEDLGFVRKNHGLELEKPHYFSTRKRGSASACTAREKQKTARLDGEIAAEKKIRVWGGSQSGLGLESWP